MVGCGNAIPRVMQLYTKFANINFPKHSFRILKHFGTKLCNLTNFKMLSLDVEIDFILLAKIQNLVQLGEWSNLSLPTKTPIPFPKCKYISKDFQSSPHNGKIAISLQNS